MRAGELASGERVRRDVRLASAVWLLASTAFAQTGFDVAASPERPSADEVAAAEQRPVPGPPPQGAVAPGPPIRGESPGERAAPTAAPRTPPRAEPVTRAVAATPSGEAVDYNAPDPDRDWLNVGRALASVGVSNALVWQYNHLVGERWAYISRDEVEANLRSGFEFDGNRLPTNFLSHPYQGSSYFNVARASGLGFWESTPLVFIGSASWELLGETEAPSTNDLLATTLGGVVLGEILYRLSSEILDDTTSGSERFFRELLALAINPGRGIERLVDGKAFGSGPPPARRRLREASIDIGLDRILLIQDRGLTRYAPRPLIAFEIEYGDLLPTGGGDQLEPFEAFDFHGTLNLGAIDELGAQLHAQGLLVGFSTDLGNETGPYRDNDVFGLVQSFDFRGAHVAQFGGMGIGPGNFVVLRFGPERRLRIGTDLQWLVIGGSSSPADGGTDRGYNYLTGLIAGGQLQLELGRYGELGLRAKQYAAFVLDGQAGEEFIGHTRAWYEIDLVQGVGLGVAPSLVHRISRYDALGRLTLAQLEAQLYARGHF